MNAKIPAIVLLTALLLPALAPAFAQELTVTEPTPGQEYNPGDDLTVKGTAPEGAIVTVQVFNPADTLVAVGQDTADSNGNYATTPTSFPSAPTASLPYGTYSVSVFSAGDTVERSIVFKEGEEPPIPPVEGAAVSVEVEAEGIHLPGEKTMIYVMVTQQGELKDPEGQTFTVWHVIRPDGNIDQLVTKKRIHTGLYVMEYTLPTITGVYGVHIAAKVGEVTGQGLATITVTDGLESAATAKAVSDMGSTLSKISSDVTSLGRQLGTSMSEISQALAGHDAEMAEIKQIVNGISGAQGDIISAVNGVRDEVRFNSESVKASVSSASNEIRSAVSSAQTSIQGAVSSSVSSAQSAITGKIDSLSGKVDQLSNDMDAVSSAVSQSITFIYVVAALAAITLVLELVILVRKV